MNAPLHREMPAGALDAERALSDVTTKWDTDILRQLTDYIAIPAKSPGFDKEWSANGYLETVLRNADIYRRIWAGTPLTASAAVNH